ncbi:MAG TPA: hypothetical protein VGV61_17225 [Thermoanaerobaculia bacterium]|nr:hypothetical protein [Thermoanaerobaculia bacterium]
MAGRMQMIGFTLALVATAVALGGRPALAAEKAATAQQQEVRTVPAAGMQVAIDPQTGRLRQPTAEESRQLLQALAVHFQPAKSVTATRWAGGLLSVVLGEEYDSVALARIDANGVVAGACVDSLAGAQQFLDATGPVLEEK